MAIRRHAMRACVAGGVIRRLRRRLETDEAQTIWLKHRVAAIMPKYRASLVLLMAGAVTQS